VNTPFVRTAGFGDASGPEDSWVGSVRYDNGPATPLALNLDKTFVLERVFSTLGTHSITVTITDAFGRAATRTFTVEAQNIGPAPQVLGAVINGGATQRARLTGIDVQWSKNVGPSLALTDLALRNLSTGATLPSTSLNLFYNAATNVLSVSLASGVILPAGLYELTLLAAGITDANSQPLARNTTLAFHILPGDANGDRVVNDRDLFLAWQNSLKPIGQQDLNADLNGDGRVTAADVQLVKTLYLTVVPPALVGSGGSGQGAGTMQTDSVLASLEPTPDTDPALLALAPALPAGSEDNAGGLRLEPASLAKRSGLAHDSGVAQEAERFSGLGSFVPSWLDSGPFRLSSDRTAPWHESHSFQSQDNASWELPRRWRSLRRR